MPGNEGQRFEIPVVSLGDIFTTQAQRDAKAVETMQMISIEDISEFPNHPFRVVEDEELGKMADSIREYGVLNPAIVRPKGDAYEMVSGHRRMRACELAGIRDMPCIVRNLSDDEAVILMVDANIQRETVSPSEKAFAYKMKLDAIKRQGERSDLTCSPVDNKLIGKKSIAIVGESSGDSQATVHRYIRLTELQPELLQKVDENSLGFRPAVEISYLRKEEQAALLEAMQLEERTPSLAQAQKMKRFSKEGNLNDAVIHSIMQEDKPNQQEKLSIPNAKLKPYFKDGTSHQQIQDKIPLMKEKLREVSFSEISLLQQNQKSKGAKLER